MEIPYTALIAPRNLKVLCELLLILANIWRYFKMHLQTLVGSYTELARDLLTILLTWQHPTSIAAVRILELSKCIDKGSANYSPIRIENTYSEPLE